MFSFIKKYRKAMQDNTAAIRELTKAIKQLAGPTSGTGVLWLELIGENGMLQGRVKLPSVPEGTPAGEVVSGKLVLTVNGTPQEFDTTPGQEYQEGLSFNEGDLVSGSFTFTDNAGNVSKTPKTFDEIEVKDTFAVEPDGEFGLEITGETA